MMESKRCWICFTDGKDLITSPCKCRGSMEFVHKECFEAGQLWRPRATCNVCMSRYVLKHSWMRMLRQLRFTLWQYLSVAIELIMLGLMTVIGHYLFIFLLSTLVLLIMHSIPLHNLEPTLLHQPFTEDSNIAWILRLILRTLFQVNDTYPNVFSQTSMWIQVKPPEGYWSIVGELIQMWPTTILFIIHLVKLTLMITVWPANTRMADIGTLVISFSFAYLYVLYKQMIVILICQFGVEYKFVMNANVE